VPSLRERKREELAAKRAALAQEFTYWRDESAADKPFRKHHTQIIRITARLEGMLAKVAAEVGKLTDDQLLAGAAEFEEKILAAHLVWEFFRSKLAMRADPYLRDYLQACDEFAWSCYEAARSRFLVTATRTDPATARLVTKEPPLVFLNSGRSPFAVAREQAFELERPAFKVDAAPLWWVTRSGEFHEVVRQLPFPVVGVPWYQIAHLPDALVIGHEMGHVLEWDFNLKEAADRALGSVTIDEKRRSAWQAWRLEIFADVCGCLAGGPRFANALADFLATDEGRRRDLDRTAPAWGEYPMRWLRIELLAATLDYMGFPRQAAWLLADWGESYPAPADEAGFRNDAAAVVKALVKGPYPTLQADDGAPPPLTSVLAYRKQPVITPGAAQDIPLDEMFVSAIRQGKSAPLANPRELFAATRLLYEQNPVEFATKNYSRRVCAMVVAQIPQGTRGTAVDDLVSLVAQECAAGERWL
jgi:hypothetical protein